MGWWWGWGGGLRRPLTLRVSRGGGALFALPVRVQRCYTGRVQMDTRRNQVQGPSPTTGSGTQWVSGGALARLACLLPVPMDRVPYPQPLTGLEP